MAQMRVFARDVAVFWGLPEDCAFIDDERQACCTIHAHPAVLCSRQHGSARLRTTCVCQHGSACVSVRQHGAACVSVCQHAAAHARTSQHGPARDPNHKCLTCSTLPHHHVTIRLTQAAQIFDFSERTTTTQASGIPAGSTNRVQTVCRRSGRVHSVCWRAGRLLTRCCLVADWLSTGCRPHADRMLTGC